MTTMILRCSQSFRLGGRPVPNFPVLADDKGPIEPVNYYLRRRSTRANAAVGSLSDEAYVLKAFWDYISSPLRRKEPITAEMLSAWSNFLVYAEAGPKISIARAQVSLYYTQRFLRASLNRSALDIAGRTDVAKFVRRIDYEFTDSASDVRFITVPKSVGRPTPTDQEVDRIFDQLAHSSSSYIATRNYMMANWMRFAGLRRGGVAGLTVSDLRNALVAEGVIARSAGGVEKLNAEARIAVRKGVEMLRSRHRTAFEVTVTEKGSKTRNVLPPIDLMLSTLEYVWGERSDFIREAASRVTSDFLWLSEKTESRLTAGAIGDIVKDAFVACEIKGSGHRLRACYAESLVYMLYERAIAAEKSGIIFDGDQILIEAAEIMGHARIESLRPYLNRAIRNRVAMAELK